MVIHCKAVKAFWSPGFAGRDVRREMLDQRFPRHPVYQGRVSKDLRPRAVRRFGIKPKEFRMLEENKK